MDKVGQFLSANKISQQKSVVCHAKIGRFCLPIKTSNIEHIVLDDKIRQLFGYRSTDFMFPWRL